MPESTLAPFPIYVRIVPKDVWLRFHVSSGQTIASIKDAALHHARAPEQDPTHSVRFYLDAADATLNAKQALAAGNAHMTKQRNNALPTVFTTPLPADLAPTLIKNAASFSSSVSPRQNLISLPHRAALSALASHWSPSKSSSNLSNLDKRSGKAPANDLHQPLFSSPSRQRPHQLATSSSTRVISPNHPPLTSIDSRTTVNSLPSSDDSGQLDTSLVRGNLQAKQEEQRAQALLLQWSQSTASLNEQADYSNSVPSLHKTPALDSAVADQDESIAYGISPPYTQSLTSTVTDPYPAQYDARIDDSETNASLYSPPLVTDDRSDGANWGTQAEDMLAPNPDLSPNSNAFALDARPRSRTVTAADAQTAGPSTSANDATLRPRGRPLLVPETAQRRRLPPDLQHLFSAESSSSAEVEPGFVRPVSPSTTLVDADTLAESSKSPFDSRNGKAWTERVRLSSMPADDVAHPLSKRFAVLSATTGCVLEDWKSAAACKLRPYDMLQMQWFVPTERVYTHCFNADFVRHSVRHSIPGPHPDSELLEPFYEGYVYMLEEGAQGSKSSESSKRAAVAARMHLATWKLRWITVKGWRLDMYRQRPRAGEISLPSSDSIWPLLAVQQVDVADSPIAANALMPALETLHGSSISISFSPLPVSAAAGETMLTAAAPSLTVRCVSRFEHEALFKLLTRAQTRVAWRANRGSSTPHQAQLTDALDRWRRQALFRSLVAGRGGTAHVGGGYSSSRNTKARARQRPAHWPAAWEDADTWSSDSETENDEPKLEPEAELESSQLGLMLH